MKVDQSLGGVIIGMLMGFKEGKPQVVFPENPAAHAIDARALARLGPDDVGSQVALLFEDGRRDRPLIIGRILHPEPISKSVVRDGELVSIVANERIELRVGKAAIIMEKDGHITIRGSELVTHASGSNRIRGASIDLN